jgi:hypothetical protein
MARPDYTRSIERRIDRWKAFHAGDTPGDLMCFVWSWGDRTPMLGGRMIGRANELGPAEILKPSAIDTMVDQYLADFRASRDNVLQFDDDFMPEAFVDVGIGVTNAALAGQGEPFFDEFTSWCEPELSWEQILELKFDPSDKWIEFYLNVNRALWARWEGDFHVSAFGHRSPLDAANGIRGNALFEEVYTLPTAVHALIDYCADWSIAMEQHLAANDGRPDLSEWGTSIWGQWMPPGTIFVNGDPVGMISRKMAEEFEQPYTAKLFEGTGGGFYHNHTMGMYQADLVTKTRGTHIQFMIDDPKCPTTAEALLHDPEVRDMLIECSLETPIGFFPEYDQVDALLDIVKQGRFVIGISAGAKTVATHADDLTRLLSLARTASNLD